MYRKSVLAKSASRSSVDDREKPVDFVFPCLRLMAAYFEESAFERIDRFEEVSIELFVANGLSGFRSKIVFYEPFAPFRQSDDVLRVGVDLYLQIIF